MRSIPAFLIALLLLAACATPTAPSQSAVVWTFVVADDGGPGEGPGISVADAVAHGPTDDLVSVSGALFVAPDGTVRLCDAIAESFPPQCGGASVVVEGLDLDTLDLEEANGVRWAEAVVLLGSVE